MLIDLRIKNFITIDEQVIHFDRGLHVFTGETGAGKSVILSALEIVLGGRASPRLIRQGQEQCLIEAQFDLSKLEPRKRSLLPEIVEGDELSISRSFNNKGRGKIYLNGRLSTASQLSEITQLIINICGQGHHMELLKEKYHVEVLDEYGGLTKKASEYKTQYLEWKKLCDKLSDLREKSEAAARRSSELEFIINDLKEAGIGEESKTELETSLNRLASSESLVSLASEAENLISSQSGILEQLGLLSSNINKLIEIDSSQEELLSRSKSINIELSELASDFKLLLGVDIC